MAHGPHPRSSSGDRRPSSCSDNRAACQYPRHLKLREKLRTFSAASILQRLRHSSENCEYAILPYSPARTPSTHCLEHTFPAEISRSWWIERSALDTNRRRSRSDNIAQGTARSTCVVRSIPFLERPRISGHLMSILRSSIFRAV